MTPSVLFVCVKNAGKSQMAAALIIDNRQRRPGGTGGGQRGEVHQPDIRQRVVDRFGAVQHPPAADCQNQGSAVRLHLLSPCAMCLLT